MVKIVIIENLPIVLEGIKLLINHIKGFEVVAEYRSGRDFINDIDKYNDEIVLTEIDLPLMDGIEITKLALTTHPNLKFIALSRYSDQSYYYEMIISGAKGFVFKQSSVEDLEIAIQEVHNGSHFFSKKLLHNVILGMQNFERRIAKEKIDLIKITDRDIKLLEFICLGYSNKQVSESLFLSIKTVESNKSKLMKKTKTRNNAGLIIWAIKNDIVEV